MHYDWEKPINQLGYGIEDLQKSCLEDTLRPKLSLGITCECMDVLNDVKLLTSWGFSFSAPDEKLKSVVAWEYTAEYYSLGGYSLKAQPGRTPSIGADSV